MSPLLTAQANGIANGIKILIVPYAVPVAKEINAPKIILVHNHPSGDPSPSEDDVLITEKVFRAGLLLDIHLLDHIIIGDRAYVSFLESGLLD